MNFIQKFRFNKIIKKLNHIGDNSVIETTVRFKNPEHISIGENCYIADYGIIEAWDKYNEQIFIPEIIIGNNVLINQYCHIGAINRIEIGDDCLFGSRVMLMDHSHGNNSLNEVDIPPAKRDLFSKGGIKIGKRVWLGENVVVLSGVEIGDNAIIGANSVVTKNIMANCVAAGVPAVCVKKL